MNTTPASKATDQSRELLRHAVATLAYRGGKGVAGDASDSAEFHAGGSARTPVAILAHIGDLLDRALTLAEGEQRWHDSEPLIWSGEVARFYRSVAKLDDYLASERPIGCPAEKLFQGPIADALTQVGQINLLRRLAGFPVRAENYFRARVELGRVGPDQSTERVEFD